MGRHKKGFNAEARKVVKGRFVDQDQVKSLETKVVVVAAGCQSNAPEGDTNALVLPDKKRRFKKDKEASSGGRILSKRRRKILEKVVDQKRKKAERGELLERLQEVQLGEEAMGRMTSIAHVQTKGLKRQMAEDRWMERLQREGGASQGDYAHVKTVVEGAKPVKRRKLQKLLPKKEVKAGPGVLGFEESSEDEDDEDEDQDESEEDEEEKAESSDSDEEEQEKAEENSPKKVEVPPKTSPSKSISSPSKESVPAPDIPQGHVLVQRSAEVQSGREKLPILGEEHAVMEAINHHPVVVLAGETGSGKTTQVPQFLYEAGYARGGKLIGVTEPRRVAAMAMSKRVAEEMGLPASVVSYQVRFEGNATDDTKIKFMTDGVLLREMSRDFSLCKYSVIVIDEAHERSVFTDILIGSLSRVVKQRARRPEEAGGPLRLVIMSATLRVEDFYRLGLFRIKEEDPRPPCVKVEGREFKVTRHNLKTTPDDYLASALKKTCQIHKDLPEGGILVFVTGQQEVNYMVRKLRKLFSTRGRAIKDDEEESVEASMKKALKTKKTLGKSSKKSGGVLTAPEVNLDRYRVVPLDDVESDALHAAEEDEDLEGLEEGDEDIAATMGRDAIAGCQPMWCLPLYSLLSTEKQNRIFEPPPEGHRLCVVSTNIAETSLTIPGIKYVVDTGKVKEKFYDKLTGVSTFQVTWTSKASADQRLGRAGRQGDGHCYRLYSTEVFKNDFPDFSKPDILRRPVEDLVLQMKSMGLIKVRNFPFPTPPDPEQLEAAERRLLALGALREREVAESKETTETPKKGDKKKRQFELVATDLGKSMNAFPVAPCFGKMLSLSEQRGLMPYTVLLVSALTVQEVLLETDVGEHSDADKADAKMVSDIRRIWAGKGESFRLGDPMLLIQAVCASERDSAKFSLREFCARYALRHKAMVEIRKLRRQLTNEVNLLLPKLKLELAPKLGAPDEDKCQLLRQILLAGMANQVARRVIPEEESGITDPKELAAAYRCDDLEDPVFLHARSIFSVRARKERLPEWVVYQERFEAGGKCFLRGATAIEPDWLPVLCRAKCTFRPMTGKESEPRFDSESGCMKRLMHVTFGWPRPFVLPDREVDYPDEKTHDPSDPLPAAYFAKFLLDPSSGACPKLEPLLAKGTLLCTPSTFPTISARNQRPEVAAFLRALSAEGAHSRRRLEEAMRKNADFLKKEFKGLVPKARHLEVDGMWPPL